MRIRPNHLPSGRDAARALAILLATLAMPAAAPAAPAESSAGSMLSSNQPVEIQVERVRAKRDKEPTLRFLKENRDFIRARIDLLRQKAREARDAASPMDPRYLAYSDMMAGILAARDSVTLADQRDRQKLLASIADLARLENDLDLGDRLLAEQRARLERLQKDFTGRQITSLIVVLSGDPGKAAVSEIAITLEGGERHTTPLSADMIEALRHGGIVQVFHGFIEPREQSIEVALGGPGWPAASAGFVRLEPARDRLAFLKLDLSHLDAEVGSSSLRASGWVNDTKPQTVRD